MMIDLHSASAAENRSHHSGTATATASDVHN